MAPTNVSVPLPLSARTCTACLDFDRGATIYSPVDGEYLCRPCLQGYLSITQDNLAQCAYDAEQRAPGTPPFADYSPTEIATWRAEYVFYTATLAAWPTP